MDRGQTMDVVDTPSHGSRDWPSIEDFQEPEKNTYGVKFSRELIKFLKYTNMVKANSDLLLC